MPPSEEPLLWRSLLPDVPVFWLLSPADNVLPPLPVPSEESDAVLPLPVPSAESDAVLPRCPESDVSEPDDPPLLNEGDVVGL